MTELMSKFSTWLFSELTRRNLSQSDLARATGLSRQTISYYLSEKSKRPDDDAMSRIARAFKLPVDQVHRAAGLLPPAPGEDEWVERMDHKIRLIPSRLRGFAEGMIDKMIEDEEVEQAAKPTWKQLTGWPARWIIGHFETKSTQPLRS